MSSRRVSCQLLSAFCRCRLEARPHTSTCLVTASTLELEVGGLVDMVQGY